MRCEWEAIFQISPGVSEPETIGEYHFFLDEKNRTCVTVQFTTESYTEKHPDRSNDSEYADDTICNQHIEKIKSLLLIRMTYQEEFRPIKISTLQNQWLNREEVKKTGAKVTRPYEQVFGFSISSINKGDSLREALNFYNQRTHLEIKNDAVLKIAS
ncbi:MAG: hypothetical protein WBM35_16825, partial [Candidatus Electrothrix sp.]